MSKLRFGLMFLAVACAEPTAIQSPAPAQVAAGRESRNNSYSVDVAGSRVYVRLSQVRGEDGEPIHLFMRRVFASADSVGARHLVIDLRSLGGGDARLLVPLVRGIVARDRFVQHGGLFVAVNSGNFGPNQNAAKLLNRYANPIFVQCDQRSFAC